MQAVLCCITLSTLNAQIKPRVHALDVLNTDMPEYGIFVADSTVYFSSGRAHNLNLSPEPQTVMYTAHWKMDGNDLPTFSEPTLLEGNLYTGIHHGPACLTPGGDTLFYTYANLKPFQKAEVQNKLRLKLAVRNGSRWIEKADIPFNSEEFNTAHPHYHAPTHYLYFASDRPGGQGGMDIWRVKRNETGVWGEPENLGPEVNSSGNEAFPTLFKGVLYFSSTGHKGMGGWDVFSSQERNGRWSSANNMGKPMNSSADDLSPHFVSRLLAFFTSSRAGTDDLYAWVAQPDDNFFGTLKGRITQSGAALSLTTLVLRDAEGTELGRAVTDSLGGFEFADLSSMEEYTLTVADTSFAYEGTLIDLYNTAGETVRTVAPDKDGGFKFELLALDDHDNLVLLEQDDDSFLKVPLAGVVYSQKPGDLGGSEAIYILSTDENVLAAGSTDSTGRFSFDNVPPMDFYRFRINIKDRPLKIDLYNAEGELIQTLERKAGEDFVYERLAVDDDYINLMMEDDTFLKIKVNESFNVSNIYYALDKWDFLPESQKELDKLVDILKRNPKVSVVLEAHTDSRGRADYNLELSEKRAQATREYLELNGIETARIEARGMGEARLLNRCEDGIDCPEDEHARNRRTEVKFNRVD